jgi:hypothetical protein
MIYRTNEKKIQGACHFSKGLNIKGDFVDEKRLENPNKLE